MIDCLILGHHDYDFPSYVEEVRATGIDSGSYRDLRLAFIEYEGKPYRSLDIFNRFYQAPENSPCHLDNTNFISAAITNLGTFLDAHGHSFDYIKCPHLELDLLAAKLLQDVRTVAITTTLYISVAPIIDLISFIRERNSTVKIILGGPYLANMRDTYSIIEIEAMLDFIDADYYIFSAEGEHALSELINCLKRGADLNELKNLAYKEGYKINFTEKEIESNPMESNMVNYELFNKKDFNRFIALRTAKSCPYSCSFCSFPEKAGKYKYLEVALVEKELDAINDLGCVKALNFIDDTFNVPKRRFKEILRMMINNKYNFEWFSYYRCKEGDDETIELMKEAGCKAVFLGIESGSNTILEAMNKKARREDYLRAIPILRDAGIATHANLIIGYPGETMDTYKETFEFIEEAKPDYFRAQLWFADSTTPIMRRQSELGIVGSAFNWTHNTMNSDTALQLVDDMFINIKNSTWLPQWGFELYSAFFLMHLGMSESNVKRFIHDFNNIIRATLLNKDRDVYPALFNALKESCNSTILKSLSPIHKIPARQTREVVAQL